MLTQDKDSERSLNGEVVLKINMLRHISAEEANFEWHGVRIAFSSYNTGKGWKKRFVCPTCERRIYELRYIRKGHRIRFCDDVEPTVMCRHCIGDNPYSVRTNLNDQSFTALLDYQIQNMVEELRIEIPFCEIQRIASPKPWGRPDLKNAIPIVSFFDFDYRDYLEQRPKNAHIKSFMRKLAKLQLLYQLRNRAEMEGVVFTATQIKEEVSAEKVNELIRETEGVKYPLYPQPEHKDN